MAFLDDFFYAGLGAMSTFKKNLERLVQQGKISQEEAQRMFEDLRENKKSDERLTPLSLSLGLAMYTKQKISELLAELQKAGKISAEETKKYYEKYIPEDIKDTEQEEEGKEEKYATKEDFTILLKKLEDIDAKLNRE